jgi:hypothetical protein
MALPNRARLIAICLVHPRVLMVAVTLAKGTLSPSVPDIVHTQYQVDILRRCKPAYAHQHLFVSQQTLYTVHTYLASKETEAMETTTTDLTHKCL